MTIKILGAGIAGLTAAIVLAKSGHLVEVFRKKQRLRHEVSWRLAGAENWSEKKMWLKSLKIGIEINFNVMLSTSFQ